MYDLRQFRPALYILLVMGIAGFAMASESPGVWVFFTIATALNAWLVKTRRFTPMPRFISNIITIVATAWVVLQIRAAQMPPILIIGDFLLTLHFVKLFEQRSNRDYAQLLVLSLLLMVAAAISTASLLFGILFIAYLFLSLYCCLLFHLKVENDHARVLYGQTPEQLPESVLQQDQRYLSSSMRRLTALVSAVAVSSAVLTFLLFPRGAGAGLLGPMQFRSSQTLTGFNDQVSFQQVARITQSDAIVAHVKEWIDGKPATGGESLWLRGVTLDVYNGSDTDTGEQWQWSRSPDPDQGELQAVSQQFNLLRDTGFDNAANIREDVDLQPTGTNVLFAAGEVTAFQPRVDLQVRYSPADSVLETVDPLVARLTYSVQSAEKIPVFSQADIEDFFRQRWRGEDDGAPMQSHIDPLIRKFALRPEVTGVDAHGASLAQYRLDHPLDPSVDEQIARNIEQYLQRNFTYSLDLTDAQRIAGQDPVVAFLYDLKRGHCEYFAGAMTLMCQSLGIPARMVVGFHCDDYNQFNHCFIVRQSQAHAWVEVAVNGFWARFDPTSSREAQGVRKTTLYLEIRHVFDYLDFAWANSVVAYDGGQRRNLLDSLNDHLQSTTSSSSEAFAAFSYKLTAIGGTLMNLLVGAIASVMFVAIGWYFWERVQLQRRVHRIGIESLPANAQQRLVRQLAFYDDLLRLLERHHIRRPANLTPMEFSDSLSFLPSDVYQDIHRLTRLFYRIRFGHAELEPAQRRRLGVVISQIDQMLAKARAPHP